jgi:hypothetical protein
LSPSLKKIPIGLARVRKEIPPPGKIFKSKKTEGRKRAKEKLRREIQEAQPSKSS